MIIASLALTSTVTFAADAPNVEMWLKTLTEQRLEFSQVVTEKKDLAAKKALFGLRKEFPILTDWVLQDGAPWAHRLLDPKFSDDIEIQLLKKVGVVEAPQDSESRIRLYVEKAQERREQRLSGVLKKWSPFVFTEGHSIVATFIGYTEGLSDARAERYFKPGGRVTVLNFDSSSTYGTVQHLIDDPHGMIRDVDISFDREKLVFAWKKSDRLDDYHIYEYNLKNNTERQLSKGLGRADYEPAYLPDGDIVFTSTRPEQSVPCWWTEISNLYRMNPDGDYIRRLAIDQVHALYPQVMNNGRITYTRWDYSDRGQVYPHPVFSMDPDGQAQRVFYGGNSWFPNSLLHTRAIPGSHKVMAIAAGHHTTQQGKLVTIDVTKGRDESVGMKFIAPVRDVPYERVDAAQQHTDQFRYPFPLSETELLISYLPHWGFEPAVAEEHIVGNRKNWTRYRNLNDYGLYWMNADGERELLYGDEKLGVQRMVSIGHKPQQPSIPDTVDYGNPTGTLYVHDVYKGVGLKGIPRGEAKTLRVVRLNYRAAGVGHNANSGPGGGSMNSTPVSVGNGTWDIKEILGDVDIHEDGSALFEVPADESIYLQVLNAKGQVIQTTRTWDTVRPGEEKGCVGCHDKGNSNFYPFEKENTMAWKNGAQKLRPFYGETRGFSFQDEVQPILNQKCISCHNPQEVARMDLTGTLLDDAQKNARKFSQSYINLTDAKRGPNGDYVSADPEGGIVTWISKMSRPTELPPYFSGAAKSPLINMLEEGHYDVELTEEENHKLAAWMDLLVPFVGTYREAHRWNDHQMKFYNYYEGKRDQQAAEELDNVQAFISQMTGTPYERKELAPFTQAVYQPVWTSDATNITSNTQFSLTSDDPFRFDRLILNANITAPVTVQLKQGQKTIDTIILKPENQPFLWQREGNTLSNKNFSLWSEADLTAVNIQVYGMREKDMPQVNGYRRHLSY